MRSGIILTAAMAAISITATGCAADNNSSSQISSGTDSTVTSGTNSAASTTTGLQTDAPTQELSTEAAPPSTDPTMPDGETVEPPELPAAAVSADYADESVDESQVCVFISDFGMPVYVSFTAEQTVTDFKILNISFHDISEDGEITYDISELYSQPEFSAGQTLYAALEFPGDMPTNGISFVDSNGAARYYALGMSGMDGSLFLSEFNTQE